MSLSPIQIIFPSRNSLYLNRLTPNRSVTMQSVIRYGNFVFGTKDEKQYLIAPAQSRTTFRVTSTHGLLTALLKAKFITQDQFNAEAEILRKVQVSEDVDYVIGLLIELADHHKLDVQPLIDKLSAITL